MSLRCRSVAAAQPKARFCCGHAFGALPRCRAPKTKPGGADPPGWILLPRSTDQGKKSLCIRAVTAKLFWSLICVIPLIPLLGGANLLIESELQFPPSVDGPKAPVPIHP